MESSKARWPVLELGRLQYSPTACCRTQWLSFGHQMLSTEELVKCTYQVSCWRPGMRPKGVECTQNTTRRWVLVRMEETEFKLSFQLIISKFEQLIIVWNPTNLYLCNTVTCELSNLPPTYLHYCWSQRVWAHPNSNYSVRLLPCGFGLFHS